MSHANTTIDRVHIRDIRPGDTVLHNGQLQTVCRSNIKRGFMGITLFGDSYRLGLTPVQRVEFNRATAIRTHVEGVAA